MITLHHGAAPVLAVLAPPLPVLALLQLATLRVIYLPLTVKQLALVRNLEVRTETCLDNNVEQCNATQCNATQRNTIQYNTLHYTTLHYTTLHYTTLQYRMI